MRPSEARPRKQRRRRYGRWRQFVPLIALVVAFFALLALYAGGAMLFGSWLVERSIARVEQLRPELQVSYGAVRVHPFRWRMQLSDLQVTDIRSGESLQVPLVTAYVHPDSLITGTIRFRRLEGTEPALVLLMPGPPVDVPGSRAFDPASRLQRLQALRIDELSVEGGQLSLAQAAAPPTTRSPAIFSQATFSLQSTSWPPATGAPAPWHVELMPSEGGRISISGEALAGDTLARGRVRLSGVDPATVAGLEALFGDLAALSTFAGAIDASGEFRTVVSTAAAASQNLTPTGASSASSAAARSSVPLVTDVVLRGDLAVAGPVTLSLTLDSVDPGGPAFVWLQLDDLPGSLVSVYTGHMFGVPAEADSAALTWQFRREGDQVNGQFELAVTGLALATSGNSPEGPHPDPALAVALLRDANSTVAFAVPVQSLPDALSGRQTHAAAITDQAVRDYLARLVAAPFQALAEQTGVASLDDTLRFVAGDASPIASAEETLRALAEALQSRPGLGLELDAPFDPELDRRNLAARQVELHITLATAGAEFGARAAELDFASPRVHDVLEEFAGERLDAAALGRLRRGFGFDAEQVPTGAPVAYYRALFDALADNERIDDAALVRLARFRAQSVVAALAAAGIDGERLLTRAAAPVPVEDRQWFYVPGGVRLMAAPAAATATAAGAGSVPGSGSGAGD